MWCSIENIIVLKLVKYQHLINFRRVALILVAEEHFCQLLHFNTIGPILQLPLHRIIYGESQTMIKCSKKKKKFSSTEERSPSLYCRSKLRIQKRIPSNFHNKCVPHLNNKFVKKKKKKEEGCYMDISTSCIQKVHAPRNLTRLKGQ